jgi:hypothetical protein
VAAKFVQALEERKISEDYFPTWTLFGNCDFGLSLKNVRFLAKKNEQSVRRESICSGDGMFNRAGDGLYTFLEDGLGTNLGLFSVFRQRKIKGGPFTDFSFSPYSAAVTVDDALDNSQTDPRAFVLLVPV